MPSRCRSRSPERVRGCRRRAGMRKLGKRTASFLRSPWMALVPALAIVLGLERKASEGESGWWLSHRTARLGVQVAVGVAGAVVVWGLSRRPPPAAPEAPAAAAAAAPPPSPGTARAQQEMSQAELSAAFARTTEAVRSGDARLGKPLQEDLLHLYALFKQATQGDCCTPRPSVLEVAAVTKWDAWHSQLGMPIHTAMTAYIELVDQLSVGNTGAEAEAEAADGSAFDPAAWFGGFGGIGLKGGPPEPEPRGPATAVSAGPPSIGSRSDTSYVALLARRWAAARRPGRSAAHAQSSVTGQAGSGG